MFDLTGKNALVTGATGGIGKAIALALYRQGATVVISGRNGEKLNALNAEMNQTGITAIADLKDTESVTSLIKETEEKVSGIDILVNNAGITRDNLSLRMKDEEWDEVININLNVPFKLARAVQKFMMKRRQGRIINISSVVGVTGNPGQCNYVATKSGMIGWSKAMAQEVAARGITVNCIAPGFIRSAMTDALTDDQKTKINAAIPLARMGEPEEIAAAAVYLASDEAAYVTGATIHVNGGMAMV